MPDKLDALFDQLTGHGKEINANGLYALRREVVAEGRQQKWSALPDHAAAVLGRAVDLYNQTSGSEIPVRLVDATAEYPALGISELTVRLEQGELGAAQTGHPEPALTFHRFVVRQGLGEIFRTPSGPRRLPFVAASDATTNGRTVLDVFNDLDLGQDGTFATIGELQAHLNGNLPPGGTHLDEDGDAGPLTLDAIRSRLIARARDATLPVQLLSLINSAQVLFQDMKATGAALAQRTIAGESVSRLYVNPLYDGELCSILEGRAEEVGG